jgi:hypothetical protein
VTTELLAGGATTVLLRRRPVYSVTTVREAQAAGTVESLSTVAWGTGTGDGYFAEPWKRDPSLLSGVLTRKRSGVDADWWPGGSTVEVTYVAGRFADTDSVSARWQEAAAGILRRLWKREAGSWAQSPQFFTVDDDSATPSGFFRAVKPMVEELLYDEIQTHLTSFA